MISFVIAEVPGSELSLHPSSWGTIFGPNFHTSSWLGCGSLGFHWDLSTSHRNMPGLVSEPALLKTWSAADASPSPALHNAKTFRNPDLTQTPCLPKALSLWVWCLSTLQHHIIPGPFWHSSHGKVFPKPCGKPVTVENLNIISYPQPVPVPHEAPTHTFPLEGRLCHCLRGNCFNSSVVISQQKKVTLNRARWTEMVWWFFWSRVH